MDFLTGIAQLGTLITALVAAASWALSRLIEVLSAIRQRGEKRRSLIRSLYAEVDFNTRDLEFFVRGSANISAIEERLRQSDSYLPHVTDAHHTIIYSSRVTELHRLGDGLTARLVLFYGLLDKIKAQIDGINQPSYSKISAAGKISVIKTILANARECMEEGERILVLFEQHHPRLALVRHARAFVDTRQK